MVGEMSRIIFAWCNKKGAEAPFCKVGFNYAPTYFNAISSVLLIVSGRA